MKKAFLIIVVLCIFVGAHPVYAVTSTSTISSNMSVASTSPAGNTKEIYGHTPGFTLSESFLLTLLSAAFIIIGGILVKKDQEVTITTISAYWSHLFGKALT